MKVLLTNDDGIEAAGLAHLRLALSALVAEENCWIVAPTSRFPAVATKSRRGGPSAPGPVARAPLL